MLDPVSDWATDFEIFDDEYVRSPFEVWDELRERCPIAHTNRRASTWLPTRYDDVVALARDIEHFSSRGISVVPPVEPVPGPGGGTAHSDEVETPTGPFQPTRRTTLGRAGFCSHGSPISESRVTNRAHANSANG